MKHSLIITLLALPLFGCVTERVATYYDMTTGEQLIPAENEVLVEALVECRRVAIDAIPYPDKRWEESDRHKERRQHEENCLSEKGYEKRWVPYEDYSLITE